VNTTLRQIPEADRAGSRQMIPLREAIAYGLFAPAAAGGRSRLLRRLGLVVWLGLLLSWQVGAETLLVWSDSPNPTAPYTDWTTAARTIQDAVDNALPGDTVLVTNGVYASGGRAVAGAMTNRVAVTKLLTLRSVNGPAVTVIQGFQVPGTTTGPAAIRCAYLTNGAVLSGFTLTNGATHTHDGAPVVREEWNGGGVYCAYSDTLVTNCALTGNVASQEGGGAYGGTLDHCTLTGNSASGHGGGVCGSRLIDCTLTANSAPIGGGADSGTLDACTFTGNSALGGGGASSCTLSNCTLTGNSAQSHGGGA